jgi:hypothetical protein
MALTLALDQDLLRLLRLLHLLMLLLELLVAPIRLRQA